MSYYALLNVSETATIKEITRAYRAKARETHPDMGGDKELFQNIQEAYSVLKHPESRARYDRKPLYLSVILFLQSLFSLSNKNVLNFFCRKIFQ